MQPFRFPAGLRTVVCLGAHPDDIEIGAGATISSLAEHVPEATFRFIILTGSDERRVEATSSATSLLGDRVEIVVGPFTDGFLPYEAPADAKRFVKTQIPDDSVDLVFAPQLEDLHQDHRFLAEVAGQLCRDTIILGYEIVKYDGGLTPPNVYVPVTESAARRKASHLRTAFPSQSNRQWFTEGAFLGLMRLRGIESNASDGYAEAFRSSKLILGPTA